MLLFFYVDLREFFFAQWPDLFLHKSDRLHGAQIRSELPCVRTDSNVVKVQLTVEAVLRLVVHYDDAAQTASSSYW